MIAEKLGINKNGFFRCRSGILYTLSELTKDGHCYATFEQLINTSIKLLDIEKEIVIITLSDMRLKKDIISETIEMDKIYLPLLFHSEIGISKLIKKILETPKLKYIKNISLNADISYDNMQIKAIKCAVNSKFMILTGSPGTGKITTTIGIINVLKNNHFKVILTASTGRAAKRMTKTTGVEEKTIHPLRI